MGAAQLRLTITTLRSGNSKLLAERSPHASGEMPHQSYKSTPMFLTPCLRAFALRMPRGKGNEGRFTAILLAPVLCHVSGSFLLFFLSPLLVRLTNSNHAR